MSEGTRLVAPVVLPCDPGCSVLRDAVVDVAADGRVDVADALAFERVAQDTRSQAAKATDAATGAQLLERASQLGYAGQQARLGAAALDTGATLSPGQTVHNIVPTRALPNGSTPGDVIEALLHVAIYAGVPRANHAIKIAKETFAEMEAAKR